MFSFFPFFLSLLIWQANYATTVVHYLRRDNLVNFIILILPMKLKILVFQLLVAISVSCLPKACGNLQVGTEKTLVPETGKWFNVHLNLAMFVVIKIDLITIYDTTVMFCMDLGLIWIKLGGDNSTSQRDLKDNTVRVDPLDNLKKYRGGYNISNKHYWSVSSSS